MIKRFVDSDLKELIQQTSIKKTFPTKEVFLYVCGVFVREGDLRVEAKSCLVEDN